MTAAMLGVRFAVVAALGTMTALPALAQDASAVAPARQAQAPNARRLELEQQLRERTGEVVKRQLNLSDEQMTRLQATNRDFEQQRTSLMVRERETRQALRAQLLSGDSANQTRVGQLLDQSIQLQRQRLELLQNEQRELGKFLTPVQRAKYFGIQTEVRKRAQQLQSAQMQQRRRMNVMRQPGGGVKK